MNWLAELKAKVRKNESLKDKTTLRIGGQARFFCRPDNEKDLKELVVAARKNKIPIFVLGAGSNILVSDKGVSGLVLKLDSAAFRKVSLRKNTLEAGSGVFLSQLIRKAVASGLSGVEFLAGIPGTVGGAIIMNAGAWGEDMAGITEKVKVMDYRGKIKFLEKKKIKFRYRNSGLNNYIILGATLRLSGKEKAGISRRIKEYLDCRHNTQDNVSPNAGCIFKNPPGFSAGKLIDLCGLKGQGTGGSRISKKHANFIVNKRNARAKDILKLIRLIKREVKNKFNINLETEIKIWQ